MGLSGRKEKQRIGSDPRNLTWSENAAKFGHTYLSKLGWDSGSGLGAAQDGRTTNITVAQKLNLLGIGAGRNVNDPNDKDGIAWKQQSEFERMLARINKGKTGTSDQPVARPTASLSGFASSSTSTPTSTTTQPAGGEYQSATGILETTSEPKAKKRKRGAESSEEADSGSPAEVPSPAAPLRRFAHHRARLLNSKKISSRSAAELAEVLGQTQASGSIPADSEPLQEAASSLNHPSDEGPEENLIKTSTTSMADYFKQKMLKRAMKVDTPIETVAVETLDDRGTESESVQEAPETSAHPIATPVATTSNHDERSDSMDLPPRRKKDKTKKARKDSSQVTPNSEEQSQIPNDSLVGEVNAEPSEVTENPKKKQKHKESQTKEEPPPTEGQQDAAVEEIKESKEERKRRKEAKKLAKLAR